MDDIDQQIVWKLLDQYKEVWTNAPTLREVRKAKNSLRAKLQQEHPQFVEEFSNQCSSIEQRWARADGQSFSDNDN